MDPRPSVPLDYAAPKPPERQPPLRTTIAVLTLGLVAGGTVAVVLPSLNRTHHHSPGQKCASNLRQIGQGVEMYANENRGAFPPDFPTLLVTQDLTSDVFVCYRTDDERATGPTTAAVAAQLTAGGHLSYVYTGRALTAKSPAGAVVAYEPLGNHRDGANVLYVDGTVKWFPAREMKKLTDELDAGHNPPRAGRVP